MVIHSQCSQVARLDGRLWKMIFTSLSSLSKQRAELLNWHSMYRSHWNTFNWAAADLVPAAKGEVELSGAGCREIYITPFSFSFWNTWNEWKVQSWSVFPRKFFSSKKNNFLAAFLQVDIYIPIGRRHNGGLAHYYRKSMEWSGESSPLGRLLMHHLSPNIYSSQNRQNGYIFTKDCCNSNVLMDLDQLFG